MGLNLHILGTMWVTELEHTDKVARKRRRNITGGGSSDNLIFKLLIGLSLRRGPLLGAKMVYIDDAENNRYVKFF